MPAVSLWPQVPEIVIGLVIREGRVLVQPRRGDTAMVGVWEFPGGKRGPDETREDAVAREVAEETGVMVRVGELLTALSHTYPDRRVSLFAYLCEPAGEVAVAGDRWVTPAEYRSRPIPEANLGIVAALERTLAGNAP